MLAYLGAFTPTYRNEISQAWSEKVLAKAIPGSEKLNLPKILGDPVQIRQWNI
jgi:dynein heavy chain